MCDWLADLVDHVPVQIEAGKAAQVCIHNHAYIWDYQIIMDSTRVFHPAPVTQGAGRKTHLTSRGVCAVFKRGAANKVC